MSIFREKGLFGLKCGSLFDWKCCRRNREKLIWSPKSSFSPVCSVRKMSSVLGPTITANDQQTISNGNKRATSQDRHQNIAVSALAEVLNGGIQSTKDSSNKRGNGCENIAQNRNSNCPPPPKVPSKQFRPKLY